MPTFTTFNIFVLFYLSTLFVFSVRHFHMTPARYYPFSLLEHLKIMKKFVLLLGMHVTGVLPNSMVVLVHTDFSQPTIQDDLYGTEKNNGLSLRKCLILFYKVLYIEKNKITRTLIGSYER